MDALDRLIEEAKKVYHFGRGMAGAGFWCDACVKYSYALGIIRSIQVFAETGIFALNSWQKEGLLALMMGISNGVEEAVRIERDRRKENPYPVLQHSTLEQMRRRIGAITP